MVSQCENTKTLQLRLDFLTNLERVMLIFRNLCSVVVEHQAFEYFVKSISIIKELISQKNSCQADNEIVEITGIYSLFFDKTFSEIE